MADASAEMFRSSEVAARLKISERHLRALVKLHAVAVAAVAVVHQRALGVVPGAGFLVVGPGHQPPLTPTVGSAASSVPSWARTASRTASGLLSPALASVSGTRAST